MQPETNGLCTHSRSLAAPIQFVLNRSANKLSFGVQSKMEFDNTTFEGNFTEGYAMEVLFRDHQVALFSVSLGSLILGLPLAWNSLWNLKARLSSFLFDKIVIRMRLCTRIQIKLSYFR